MLNMRTILLHGDNMNILNDTKLLFLNIGKYDFSNKPRPFFSIGMIIKGHGCIRTDGTDEIDVFSGDIIVIPY